MKNTLTKTIIATVFTLLAICISPITANAASEEIIGCQIRTTDVTEGFENQTRKVVSVPADERFIVIAEKADEFLICYQEQYIWIKSSDVLVNIACFIPNLDVRLAMSQQTNYFQMADETIDGITNRQFYTAEGSKNGTEAWLRYETATKLKNAQEKFTEDGYGIVIYDAYRPYSTTVEFQKAYRNFLNQKPKSFKTEWFGKLGESWFLAQKASSHNFGVAVDMTLKKLDSNEVVEMPATIHTLDKRSAYYMWKDSKTEEAKAARYMKDVMEECGFSYLKSEWWHFQDNDIARGEAIDVPN